MAEIVRKVTSTGINKYTLQIETSYANFKQLKRTVLLKGLAGCEM